VIFSKNSFVYKKSMSLNIVCYNTAMVVMQTNLLQMLFLTEDKIVYGRGTFIRSTFIRTLIIMVKS